MIATVATSISTVHSTDIVSAPTWKGRWRHGGAYTDSSDDPRAAKPRLLRRCPCDLARTRDKK
ncbi:hypothetical protein GCM10009591_25510 [Brachybacterium tyrofermentans]